MSITTKVPTLDELRAAIPAHCFEKNALVSMYYLAQDFVILGALYLAVPFVESTLGIVGILLWYWVVGMVGFGLFVVGHECGHGTFSRSSLLNDICGHIAHAPLFVPFWPWAKSHRQHHQFTSHLDKDKGHPWITEEYWQFLDPITRHWQKIPFSSLISWHPMYLLVGIPDGSHFWPGSKLFHTRTERIQCFVSTLACFFCAGVAYYMCSYNAWTFFKYYVMPLSFCGFWITMVTYLQHREDSIEVYEEGTWAYVRGQMQTVDRTYGFGMDQLLHHITDGHVAHHLFFRQIPHYHLMEATRAIQKVLAPYGPVYRNRSNYDFLYEYFKLNISLEYVRKLAQGVWSFHEETKVE